MLVIPKRNKKKPKGEKKTPARPKWGDALASAKWVFVATACRCQNGAKPWPVQNGRENNANNIAVNNREKKKQVGTQNGC